MNKPLEASIKFRKPKGGYSMPTDVESVIVGGQNITDSVRWLTLNITSGSPVTLTMELLAQVEIEGDVYPKLTVSEFTPPVIAPPVVPNFYRKENVLSRWWNSRPRTSEGT